MKQGFTIVELLAAIAIMGLVIIIIVPAYEGISKTIKEQSYNSKISMLTKSTTAYINKYHKDKVFDGNYTTDVYGNKQSNKICYKLEYLIERNVFMPDNETENGVTDPLNGGDLAGYLVAQYDFTDYEVDVTYEENPTNCTKKYELGD